MGLEIFLLSDRTWIIINEKFIGPALEERNLGRLHEAELILRDGWEETGDPHVAFWLGKVLAEIGEHPYEARTFLEMARERYPKPQFKEKARRELVKLAKESNMLKETIPKDNSKTLAPGTTIFGTIEEIWPIVSQSIKKATKSIQIISPWITESTLIDVLEERRQAGVDIEIIIQARTEQTKKIVPQGIVEQLYSKFRLQALENLHTKLVLVDCQLLYSGSANLTRSGLLNALESGLVTNDPKIVKQAIKFVDRVLEEAKARALDVR